jgi:hypothetical protein
MAYPNNRVFSEERVSTSTTSIGGTPVACYVGVPFRGRITKWSLVAQGAITTADAAIAVAVNGTANSAMAGTLPVASAAAGQILTVVPTSPVYVNEDDVVKFTPSGASGASIGGLFTIYVQEQ